jgi:hypothetical protein
MFSLLVSNCIDLLDSFMAKQSKLEGNKLTELRNIVEDIFYYGSRGKMFNS